MASVSEPTLKEWAMDIGDGIWGTVQGAFNERQTTTQIIVDAAIGMIPLVGDVTAARDLLAVSIRMIQEPKRREETMEWVLLVILIFALIPVVGGIIKGVGRLALKIGKNVAENHKVLAEVIGFLNRIGHGNAVKWLKSLDVLKYEKELISKFTHFCESISNTIAEIIKARVGQMLPDAMRNMLAKIQGGMLELRDLASKMIPLALKELNTRLKVLQEMVYQGEVHMLATGEKQLTREVEHHLLEKEVRAAIKAGKWPQNLVMGGDPSHPILQRQLAKIFDQKKNTQGWPDLLRSAEKHPGHGGVEFYKPLSTFSGKIAAWGPEQYAEQTIYRAFGSGGKLAGASNAQGYFWGAGHIPQSAKEWREMAAVLDEWNANGLMVLVTFPSLFTIRKEKELEQALKGWYGDIAEQFGDKIKNQYLEGGGKQLGMGALPAAITAKLAELGEAAKGGQLGKGEVMGVKIEVRKTNWTDVEGKYGYAADGDGDGDGDGEDLSQYAKTRQLETDEIKSKTSNGTTVAAARAGSQNKEKTQ